MAGKARNSLRRGVVAAGLSLALGAAPLFASTARATTLDELQAQIDSCSEAYNTAVDNAVELQDKISENEQLISQIEAELPGKKDAAASSIKVLYKLQQGASGLIDLLLSADDFNDVITTVQYLDHVVERNNETISDLTSASEELDQARSALESEKAQADEQVSSAMASLQEANSAREKYEAELAAQKAAEEAAKAQAEAEAAAKAQQEAEAKAQAEAEAAASASSSETTQTTSGSTTTQQDSTSASGSDSSASAGSAATSGSGATSGTPSSATSGSASSSASSSSSSDVESGGEWMNGLASAYDIEDNTGGTATASGIPLTHDSMTVAVPVSQSYLLGRTVEIRYSGKTVTATVTDTGGFASYGRVLDLAGGVWQAFGFSSGDDWGVRAVSYRFL
jgi:peptidoglycan DL-endopeptidase CwlO